MDVFFSPDSGSEIGSDTDTQMTDPPGPSPTPPPPLSPLSRRPIQLYCNHCNKEAGKIYSLEDTSDFRVYIAYFRSPCCGWFIQTQPPTELIPGIPISDLRKGQYHYHASYSSPITAEDIRIHYEKNSPYSTLGNPDGWLIEDTAMPHTFTGLPEMRAAKKRTLDPFEDPGVLPSAFISVFDSPAGALLFPTTPLRPAYQAQPPQVPNRRTTKHSVPIYRHIFRQSIPFESLTSPPANPDLDIIRPARGRCFRWFMCGPCHTENMGFGKAMVSEQTWLVYRTAKCDGQCEVFEVFPGKDGKELRLVKWTEVNHN